MKIRITYCEKCDDLKFPKELIKRKGKCSSCKKDTLRIALFDTEGDVKALLGGEK